MSNPVFPGIVPLDECEVLHHRSAARHLLMTIDTFCELDDAVDGQDLDWVIAALAEADCGEAFPEIREHTLDVWVTVITEYPVYFKRVWLILAYELSKSKSLAEQGHVLFYDLEAA